jgi:hypothetical protein
MKKVIFITILLYSFALGQSWNNPITTTISASSLEKMDLFTNKDGNHLLIKNSNGNIFYYNINSQGTVDNNRIETLESNGDYPAITGSNNKIYAIYKAGNYIKGKYSTNGGTDWTALSNITVGSNACNGIDALYEINTGVHLVYAMRDNDPYFETYYYLLNTNNAWVNYKNVTDYGSEVGGIPSVAFSNNRVHVSYNSEQATPPYIGVGVSKSRDKVGSTWQDPQLVSDGEIDYGTSREKIQVRGDKLFCIFYDAWVDLGQYGYEVQVKSRDLTGSSWPVFYTQIFTSGEPRILMGAETTSNSYLNVVHYYFDNGVVYKYYDGTQWSNDYQVTSDYINYEMQHLGFAKTSNDLFVTWKSISSNYIKYRQYDAIPLIPQNLAVEIYTEEGYTYPKLTWNIPNEPDVYIKTNAYQIWRRYSLRGGPWSAWSIIGYSDGNESEYIDYTIGGLYAEANTAEYKIKVRDYASQFSDFSSVVSINFSYFTIPKLSVGNMNYDYNLAQNYPNPFNPTTTIDYSIKSSGLVTLKVYDMLGIEVESLVNERKEPGNYSAIFNAEDLPSGIYVYSLTSGNFRDTKKLILLK